jgi:hypothetical protein
MMLTVRVKNIFKSLVDEPKSYACVDLRVCEAEKEKDFSM